MDVVGVRLNTSLALLALASGCVPLPLSPREVPDRGAELFNGYGAGDEPLECYRCHGPQGAGTIRGPNLQWLVPRVDDHRICDQIENGDAIMPAYRDRLRAADIDAIIRWMRAGFPTGPRVLPKLDPPLVLVPDRVERADSRP